MDSFICILINDFIIYKEIIWILLFIIMRPPTCDVNSEAPPLAAPLQRFQVHFLLSCLVIYRTKQKKIYHHLQKFKIYAKIYAYLSTTLCLILIFSQSLSSSSADQQSTTYEILRDYNFPVGLLPKGVLGYDLDRRAVAAFLLMDLIR